MRPARIVCLDLDTFFVSVERLIDPSLEGKPVIVGGAPGSRGVVTACSYEVRAHGVRSGMSLTEAARLAPDAIYLPTRHDTYGDYAAKVREVASSYTPESRVASIDEMYLDFRGCERVYARPGDADADATIERVVREITARIRAELGLPSSAGIGSSRSVAKIASGLAKPAGVRMVRAGEEAAFLAPLPVRRLPGIGPVAEGRLVGAGITTIGALAGATIATLRPILGAWAESTRARASGEGSAELGRDRPAFREHDEEGDAIGSISNERTFDADVGDPRAVEDWLASLTERVCWRARRRGVRARTITLKLRYADFSTRTRSKTTSPTHSELEVWPIVLELFAAAHTRPRARVRLVGLALSNLGHFDDQLELFERHERLHRAVDEVRARFGFDALRTARGLTVERGRGER